MKKNDLLLIGCLVLIAGLSSLFYFFAKTDENAQVIITIDGQNYGTYLLKEETQIDIKGKNTLYIKNGRVQMVDADCKDQICVHHKPISKSGESIICLPNKLIVTVESKESEKLDAVSE